MMTEPERAVCCMFPQAFVLYPSLETEPLTPSRAFTSLALCDSLGLPLLLFPILVNFLANARRSTSRLQTFFAEPEIKHNRLRCPWSNERIRVTIKSHIIMILCI